MPQAFVSSLTQSIGNAGYLVCSWQHPQGLGNVSVSFLPTLVRSVQQQFTPLQKVNISLNGTMHIFQYGLQEPLLLPLEFQDLPYDVTTSRFLGHPTDGYKDLLSFVRSTLNYSEQRFTVLTPDGLIETVRYVRGIEQFREAAGQTTKAGFWTGTLVVNRIIP